MKKRPYNLSVRAQADDTYEISVRGIIGEYMNADWTRGDTETDVLNELAKIPVGKKFSTRVNSKGGSVDLALGIYNALSRRAADNTTYNDGYACSAGSIVMLSGARRVFPSSSLTMIHRAQGGVDGTGDDMRTMAVGMDAIDAIMAQTYAAASGKKSKDEFLTMMDKTTWLTGEQALELGLATDVTGETEPDEDDAETAKAELKIVAHYKNTPKDLLSRLNAKAQATALPPQPPTQPTNKNKMKNIIAALVASGITGLAADADETQVLPHVTALLADNARLKNENTAHVAARKSRVEALLNTAITDKVLIETRKPGLLALGSASAEGEIEVAAQINELRAALVTRAPRGAKPAARIPGDETGDVESQLEDIREEMSKPGITTEQRAALVAKSLKLRGLDNLYAPESAPKN